MTWYEHVHTFDVRREAVGELKDLLVDNPKAQVWMGVDGCGCWGVEGIFAAW